METVLIIHLWLQYVSLTLENKIFQHRNYIPLENEPHLTSYKMVISGYWSDCWKLRVYWNYSYDRVLPEYLGDPCL